MFQAFLVFIIYQLIPCNKIGLNIRIIFDLMIDIYFQTKTALVEYVWFLNSLMLVLTCFQWKKESWEITWKLHYIFEWYCLLWHLLVNNITSRLHNSVTISLNSDINISNPIFDTNPLHFYILSLNNSSYNSSCNTCKQLCLNIRHYLLSSNIWEKPQ